MSDFSAADCRYMARALELARRGLTTAHPNPRVGCVLVANGGIVGEGWHERTGEAHAEVNALAMAGTRAAGATAYVTLEPCSHQGRTGPCTRALLEAGVVEVVSATEDPSPHASGRGLEILRQAGVAIRSGLMRAEACALNAGFISRIRRGRPFVRLKIAASLDGATAMHDGHSQWITSEAARADVQRLRAMSGAVLTGAGTVVADDPSLTVRTPASTGGQPLRAIVDSALRMSPRAKLLSLPGETVVFCTDDGRRAELEQAGASVRRVPAGPGGVDLPTVLAALAREYHTNELLAEAGPGLAGSLMTCGLVDELVIYQAPHIMGSETRGMFETPRWRALGDGTRLAIIDVRCVGEDLRITARPLAANP
jgi:diaminohydroxyphosphoribosylaminopyrimidine deaminase/5-amino-6-(5-phosphoribosylamino)uracil reductase